MLGGKGFASVDLITVPNNAEVRTKDSTAGEGADLLLKAQAALADLKSFRCRIENESTAQYPGDKAFDKRIYDFAFRANGEYRFEGTDTNGDRLAFGSDGQAQWNYVPGRGMELQPKWSIANNLEAYQGVTAMASIVLPSCALQVKWNNENLFLPDGHLLEAMSTKAEVGSDVEIDGHACYQVVCERSIATWTFAIDKETFLLRRTVIDESPAQMTVQRTHGGGGMWGRIQEMHTIQTYLDINTNPELPDDFFDPSSSMQE